MGTPDHNAIEHNFIRLKTYIRPEVVGVPEEGVEDLPGGHDDYVDGEQDPHNQEQLGVLHHLRWKSQRIKIQRLG